MQNFSFLGDVRRLSLVGRGWLGWGWGKAGNKAKLSPASAGALAELGKRSVSRKHPV